MIKLNLDDIINVGFGYSYLLKDGVQIWEQEDNTDDDNEIEWTRLEDIEAIAQTDLTARYLLVQEGAMHSRIYERFATGWIEIRSMLGFADDESDEAFHAELAKVRAENTLTFIGNNHDI